MKLKKLINGRALFVDYDKVWVAQGMTFFAVDFNGKRVSNKIRVGSIFEWVLGLNRLSRQLLRNGLHHLLPLKNGNLLVTAKRKTYIVNPKGKIVNIFQGYQGNKPGHQGVCLTPDGTIFFAEYLLNPERDHHIRLYRSRDNGMSFQVVKEWEPGEICHLHFVKYDPYEKCLWLGTGDYGKDGSENRLYFSDDNGDSWQLIGQGSQDWRAIGVCFTKDELIWGSDAGSCPDTAHFVRMNRKAQILEILEDFEGPCHGCATFADGRVFFSTGVEGGENEKDKYARLKEYRNGKTETLWKLKKDIWPFIIQYGVMRFPLGTENTSHIVFTTMGLKAHGETVMIEKKHYV